MTLGVKWGEDEGRGLNRAPPPPWMTSFPERLGGLSAAPSGNKLNPPFAGARAHLCPAR